MNPKEQLPHILFYVQARFGAPSQPPMWPIASNRRDEETSSTALKKNRNYPAAQTPSGGLDTELT
jgi:hypothetical protein